MASYLYLSPLNSMILIYSKEVLYAMQCVSGAENEPQGCHACVLAWCHTHMYKCKHGTCTSVADTQGFINIWSIIPYILSCDWFKLSFDDAIGWIFHGFFHVVALSCLLQFPDISVLFYANDLYQNCSFATERQKIWNHYTFTSKSLSGLVWDIVPAAVFL